MVLYSNGVGTSHNGGACCSPANSIPLDDVGLARVWIDVVDEIRLIDRRRVSASRAARDIFGASSCFPFFFCVHSLVYASCANFGGFGDHFVHSWRRSGFHF